MKTTAPLTTCMCIWERAQYTNAEDKTENNFNSILF